MVEDAEEALVVVFVETRFLLSPSPSSRSKFLLLCKYRALPIFTVKMMMTSNKFDESVGMKYSFYSSINVGKKHWYLSVTVN